MVESNILLNSSFVTQFNERCSPTKTWLGSSSLRSKLVRRSARRFIIGSPLIGCSPRIRWVCVLIASVRIDFAHRFAGRRSLGALQWLGCVYKVRALVRQIPFEIFVRLSDQESKHWFRDIRFAKFNFKVQLWGLTSRFNFKVDEVQFRSSDTEFQLASKAPLLWSVPRISSTFRTIAYQSGW